MKKHNKVFMSFRFCIFGFLVQLLLKAVLCNFFLSRESHPHCHVGFFCLLLAYFLKKLQGETILYVFFVSTFSCFLSCVMILAWNSSSSQRYMHKLENELNLLSFSTKPVAVSCRWLHTVRSVGHYFGFS